MLLCYCKRWFVRVVPVCLYGQKPWVQKSRGLTPRISSFLYFTCIHIGQRWLYPTCVSSDLDIKSEELLWVSAGSTFIFHWYSFIIGGLLFGYSNLLLVHLLLKHRGNVFFRQDMVEKIALQVRCWYQAKIKVTCSIFLRKPYKKKKKTEKR